MQRSRVFQTAFGKLDLSIVDADTTLRTDNEDEIIIQMNQALSKLDEYVLLISTFKVRYNVTILDTEPIKLDPRSQFIIVLPNKDDNSTVVKFMLRGIAVGTTIRTPRDETGSIQICPILYAIYHNMVSQNGDVNIVIYFLLTMAL